jgi:O-antigen/teichoic acid export membrane protein
MPSQLKLNILANYAGSAVTAVMGFLFVPFYIKFMGIESFGLVGFYASLQALFSLLDMGLSTTLNRELAKMSADEGMEHEERDVVRTLEIIYWVLALIVGLAVALLSWPIAQHWFHLKELSPNTVRQAILITGLVMALRWPFSLYSSGLLGLQKQVLLNCVQGVCATLRGAGAVVVLWLISPTIQAFFLWQIVVSALETGLTAHYLWRTLPAAPGRPTFQKKVLKRIWRFSAGVTGISAMALILTEADKIILSKILPLESFAYYVLAWTVAGGLLLAVRPIYLAMFPRLCGLTAASDAENLRNAYHSSCQLVSVIVFPLTAIVTIFSYEILLAWTRDPITSRNTWVILSLLSIGTCLNGLMYLPSALQLARGWTSLIFGMASVSVVLLVPLLLWMTSLYGSAGAAIVWVLLNAGSVIVAILLMHRRILPGEQWNWYVYDVAAPAAVPFCIAAFGKLLMPQTTSTAITIGCLAGIFGLCTLGASLAAPSTRKWAFSCAGAGARSFRPISRGFKGLLAQGGKSE